MEHLCQGCGWPPGSPCPGRRLCADGFGIDIPPFLRRESETPQAAGARRARYRQLAEGSRFVEFKGKRRPWLWPKGADCKTEEGRKIIAMIKGAEKDKERAQAERFKQLRERGGQ